MNRFHQSIYQQGERMLPFSHTKKLLSKRDIRHTDTLQNKTLKTIIKNGENGKPLKLFTEQLTTQFYIIAN